MDYEIEFMPEIGIVLYMAIYCDLNKAVRLANALKLADPQREWYNLDDWTEAFADIDLNVDES